MKIKKIEICGFKSFVDRTVVLIDRLYDRDIPVRASGVPLDRIFSEEMLRGGYRKKYRRALSRAVALARMGDTPADGETGPPDLS